MDQGDVRGQGLDRHQFFAGEGVGHDPEVGIDRKIHRAQDAPDRQKRHAHAPRLESPQQCPSGVLQAVEPARLHRGPEVWGHAVFLQAHLGEVEAVATPAPTARSTLRPPVGTVTSPRRRRPWRTSSRIRAMGRPGYAPQGHQVPVLTSAAALAQASPNRWHRGFPVWDGPPGGPAGSEGCGRWRPDHLLAVLPIAHPGGAALEDVRAGAPALRGVKLRHRQGQQTLDLPGAGLKVVGVRDEPYEGQDLVAGDGGYPGRVPSTSTASGARPISSTVSRRAVANRLASSGSRTPPGRRFGPGDPSPSGSAG